MKHEDKIEPINIYFICRSGLFSMNTFTQAIWLKRSSRTQLISVKATTLFHNLRGKQLSHQQLWGEKRYLTFFCNLTNILSFFFSCSRLEIIAQTFKSLRCPILRNISHLFNYRISLREQGSPRPFSTDQTLLIHIATDQLLDRSKGKHRNSWVLAASE